jgi:hypothetical protein
MTAIPADERRRQAARTDTVSFVVQVHADDGTGAGSFRGRAEHLASGNEHQFTTVAGLLEFLRRQVADHRARGSAPAAGDEGPTK